MLSGDIKTSFKTQMMLNLFNFLVSCKVSENNVFQLCLHDFARHPQVSRTMFDLKKTSNSTILESCTLLLRFGKLSHENLVLQSNFRFFVFKEMIVFVLPQKMNRLELTLQVNYGPHFFS